MFDGAPTGVGQGIPPRRERWEVAMTTINGDPEGSWRRYKTPQSPTSLWMTSRRAHIFSSPTAKAKCNSHTTSPLLWLSSAQRPSLELHRQQQGKLLRRTTRLLLQSSRQSVRRFRSIYPITGKSLGHKIYTRKQGACFTSYSIFGLVL